MPGLGSTIAVVNKSGKVVSTSKHIANVFKEAKSAYLERKAELKAARTNEPDSKHRRPRVEDDNPSMVSSRHSSRRSSRDSTTRPHRRSEKTTYESDHYSRDNPNASRRTRTAPPSPLALDEHGWQQNWESEGEEDLTRRHSYPQGEMVLAQRPKNARQSSIDMDLAYGELPPPISTDRKPGEVELRDKMSALNRLLEEANCLQFTATAIIKNLEKNPDAMAAVALTLAEISNIIAKVGPGALLTMKGAFPAVIALLTAPEFLIAAGVGVGITVVALGGYKIVKKIKAKKDIEAESQADELEEIGTDLSKVEYWRQGIASEEAQSLGTSVDGEFITPGAAKQMRAEGSLPPRDRKAKDKKEKSKAEKNAKDEKKKQEKRDKKDKKDTPRTKSASRDASGIRMIFKTDKQAARERTAMYEGA